MYIKNYKLTSSHSEVQQIPCPKNKEKFGNLLPDTIVIHYTAGRSGESSARYLSKNGVQASAHLVVDRSGEIFQLVPFDTIAWHAGRSRHLQRKGLNKYSLGIEIDNAGILEQSGSLYRSWFGKTYEETDVIYAQHRNERQKRYWHAYTEAQILAVFEICETLAKHFPIEHILGHEEISPGRKQDPGPAFPLDKLREDILNPRSSDTGEPEAGIVDAPFLNIRELPSASSAKVANALPQGSKVTILHQRRGWYLVKTTIEGWVSAHYIDKT